MERQEFLSLINEKNAEFIICKIDSLERRREGSGRKNCIDMRREKAFLRTTIQSMKLYGKHSKSDSGDNNVTKNLILLKLSLSYNPRKAEFSYIQNL